MTKDAALLKLRPELDRLEEQWFALRRDWATEENKYDDRHIGRFVDRAYRLTHRALKLKARTAAGVAVQIRAFGVSDNESFEAPLDGSEDHRIRLLLESVCTVLDVKPVPQRWLTEKKTRRAAS